MGAAVAVIAAAHAKRINEILDAFRVAGATAPDRARNPAELGLSDHARQVEELTGAQVLRYGLSPGTLFLDEGGYLRYRDHGDSRRNVAILVVLLLVMVLLVSVLFLKRP